jgi:hypothetical protein
MNKTITGYQNYVSSSGSSRKLLSTNVNRDPVYANDIL